MINFELQLISLVTERRFKAYLLSFQRCCCQWQPSSIEALLKVTICCVSNLSIDELPFRSGFLLNRNTNSFVFNIFTTRIFDDKIKKLKNLLILKNFQILFWRSFDKMRFIKYWIAFILFYWYKLFYLSYYDWSLIKTKIETS